MLTDLGLQTQEEIDTWSERRNNFDGCINFAICKNCKHGFRDSICLCAGLGKCPNCGFDNTIKFEFNADGVLGDNIFGQFCTKENFIKIVNKVFDNPDYNQFIAQELKEEINKL